MAKNLISSNFAKIKENENFLYLEAGQYSTEEVLIGTWIDGKPIYRKVITMTLPNNSVTYWTDVTNSPEGIETIVNVYGSASNNAPLPFYESTDYFVIFNSVGTTKLKYQQKGYNNFGIRLVIEYTKTTD